MTEAARVLRATRLLVLGLTTAACGTGMAQGLWQGASCPVLAPQRDSSAGRLGKWLVLDTGGSGGGFGQGDIRQKLQDVHFWDDRVGWTCGYGGVFRTADGGLTWTRMKPKGGWYHVEMAGPTQVWLLEGFHGFSVITLVREYHANVEVTDPGGRAIRNRSLICVHSFVGFRSPVECIPQPKVCVPTSWVQSNRFQTIRDG